MASFSFSPFAKTSTRTDLPVPFGSTTAPRTIWSECFGLTPSLSAMSTLSSNLAAGFFVMISRASSNSNRFAVSILGLMLRNSFPCLGISTLRFYLFHDIDSHAPRGTLNNMYRSGQVYGIEIGELGLCDFLDLASGDCSHLFFIRRAAPLDDPHGLLDQDCGRGSFR